MSIEDPGAYVFTLAFESLCKANPAEVPDKILIGTLAVEERRLSTYASRVQEMKLFLSMFFSRLKLDMYCLLPGDVTDSVDSWDAMLHQTVDLLNEKRDMLAQQSQVVRAYEDRVRDFQENVSDRLHQAYVQTFAERLSDSSEVIAHLDEILGKTCAQGNLFRGFVREWTLWVGNKVYGPLQWMLSFDWISLNAFLVNLCFASSYEDLRFCIASVVVDNESLLPHFPYIVARAYACMCAHGLNNLRHDQGHT
jgi:hypothetical protein